MMHLTQADVAGRPAMRLHDISEIENVADNLTIDTTAWLARTSIPMCARR